MTSSEIGDWQSMGCNAAAATDTGENASAGHTAIAHIDRQERFCYASPAYCQDLGRDCHELVGHTVAEVLGPELYNTYRPGIQAALAGRSYGPEVRRTDADGRETVVRQICWEPVHDSSGEIVGCYLIELDVPAPNKLEVELLEARKAVKAASEAKSRFVSKMNHKIRTPMAAMLGYVELLARREDDPEKLELLDTVCRNGDLLTDIIDDMLDLAKVEAGKLQVAREAFDLDELLADIHATMRDRAEEKQLDFSVQQKGVVPEVIETDLARLRKILVNLIDNAIRYTEAGEVRLTICAVDGRADRLRFEVADTGIGLTAEQIARVLGPSTQVDLSPSDSNLEVGLGLSISRRFAELLDGSIEVISQPGKGSVFSCEIGIVRAACATTNLLSQHHRPPACADTPSERQPLQ